MRVQFVIPVLATILILGTIGLSQEVYAPPPEKAEKIRIDSVSWDSTSQEFTVELSSQFGPATAGENAEFNVCTTLIISVSSETVAALEQCDAVQKQEGATKDADGFVVLVPQIIPWDRNSGTVFGFVNVSATSAIENSSGNQFAASKPALVEDLRIFLVSDLNNLALALASSGISAMDENLIAFNVDEQGQGDGDLNGDGDVLDRFILHVHDTSARTTTNVGLDASFGISMEENLIAFIASEAAQGEDLNSNGEISFNDRVIHIFDTNTKTTTNLGLGTCGHLPAVDGRFVAFSVWERSQGNIDLNGDGDDFDCVVHLYDHNTGIITNLGLAHVNRLVIEENHVIFSVRESSQGDTDLDGNGDATNDVLHTHDIGTKTTTNWELHTRGDIPVNGNLIAFSIREESREANRDINGDGDLLDFFVHVVDLNAKTVTPILSDNAVIFSDDSIGENLVAITASPGTIKIYDASTGTLTDTGLPNFTISLVDGNLVIIDAFESRAGIDLNGDGDISSEDRVLHVFDTTTETATNLELALSYTSRTNLPVLQVSDGIIVFAVNEFAQGKTDLNGDGDGPFSDDSRHDDVLHMYDTSTGVTTNLSIATNSNLPLAGNSNVFYFMLDENEQGRIDTNGNLGFGSVFNVLDASTGTITNTGLDVGTFLSADGSIAAFGAAESSSGVRTDLNGDGVLGSVDDVLYTFDAMVSPVDTSAGLTVKTGESITLFDSTVSGDVVVDGGILVLIKSTVDGNISVINNGLLTVIGSMVNGDINTQDSQSVSLTTTQITGDVISTNDKSIGIRLSTINGSVIIDGAQGVDVKNSTVDVQLLVQNNGDVTVTDNAIGNVLKVTDNVSCVEGNNTAPDKEVIGCDPPPPGGGTGGL